MSQYNETQKLAVAKYKRDKQHPVSLAYRQEEWDTVIFPAISKSNMPVATFIKQAIQEKIKRDNL